MQYKVTKRQLGVNRDIDYIRIHLDGKHVSVYKGMDMKRQKLLLYYVWETAGTEIESPDMDEYLLPETLIGLSEEEMFQRSLVWDYPIDIYLFKNIQEYYAIHGVPEDDRAEWYQEFGDSE